LLAGSLAGLEIFNYELLDLCFFSHKRFVVADLFQS
jgi:hypothetical protein